MKARMPVGRKVRHSNQRGQSEIEFMLILPFFLAVVFALLTFVMLVFKKQMLTYATFMGGRTAAVHPASKASDEAREAARRVMPGVNLSVDLPSTPSGAGPMTIQGRYWMDPLARAAEKSSLDGGMSSGNNLEVDLQMHHFQSPKIIWNPSNNNRARDDNAYTLE